MGTPQSDSKLNQAREALSQADFSRAIVLLEEIVVDESDNAEAWCQLGVCYLETQQAQNALEALVRAVRADPQDAMAHYLLGNAHGTLGQLERAAACYRRALDIDPLCSKAEEFLIRTESLLESREHYRTALRLLYSQEPSAGDLNRALQELVQSVAIFENSPARDNLLECARGLLGLRQEQPLPMPITAEIEPWASACERGYQCFRFRNWIGAQAAYDEALTYRASDAFVHHALGFSFLELGDVDNAVRAWLRTLELDRNYDFTRFGHVIRSS